MTRRWTWEALKAECFRVKQEQVQRSPIGMRSNCPRMAGHVGGEEKGREHPWGGVCPHPSAWPGKKWDFLKSICRRWQVSIRSDVIVVSKNCLRVLRARIPEGRVRAPGGESQVGPCEQVHAFLRCRGCGEGWGPPGRFLWSRRPAASSCLTSPLCPVARHCVSAGTASSLATFVPSAHSLRAVTSVFDACNQART